MSPQRRHEASRLTWYEQQSYAWPPEPGDEIAECVDCGPFWRCAVEAAPDAPHGIAIREWHTDDCPCWGDDDKQESADGT